MSSLILLLVYDIMSQDKKVKKNDIEKLRMILDSPSDPKVRKIVDKHEKNLESIRERLSNEPSKTEKKYSSSDFLKKSNSLEPRVVIHQKGETKNIKSEIVSPEPKLYKAEKQQKEEEKLPDWEPVGEGRPGESYTDEDDLQSLFDDEDLLEVEKVDVSEPEFLQVKPKEMEKIFEKTPKEKEQMIKENEKEERLPDWEPVGDGRPDETITKKAVDEDESVEEMDKKDEMLPEWEPVDEEKSKEIGETVKEKEESTIKEFTEVKTIEEKTLPPKNLNETKEEIHTWEPIKLEKTKVEKEMPSEIIEEKPADATFEEVSEVKVEAPVTDIKKIEAEQKRRGKELKKKRKEEKKLKKIEEKKSKRAAKQNEKETKRAEVERGKNLQIEEYEQKKIQKEEKEKQKKLEEEEKKQISEIVAQGENEVSDKSEIKAKKIEEKRAKNEKEAHIKAQIKKDKILVASEKKELKKSKKRKKEEEKNKGAEPKTPELKKEKNFSFEKKIVEDMATEWESYHVDVVPNTKADTSIYTHGDFILYKKEIKTVDNKKRTVHFFSKKTPDEGDAVQLPDGYEVKVNTRTALPYLKKK